jgi:hypothetical protein
VSGPVSITIAALGPARITVESPCPTSQLTTSQSRGGQPGWVSGRRQTTTSAIAVSTHSQGRRHSSGSPAIASPQAATRIAMPATFAGQTSAAPGRALPAAAIQHRAWAKPPAPQPSTAATGGSGTDNQAVANPRTVPGPTSGAATRFANSPITLTCPEIAVTTGWVASWAAIGTVMASASQRGSQPASCRVQTGPSTMMPALASTERTKPTDRDSHGSTSRSATMPDERNRSPWRGPAHPSAASPTSPIAAARRTLGSARQSTTKAATPTTATARRHQPSSPRRDATHSRLASIRVRFAPETASRWVSPVLRNCSACSSVTALVSPTTSAGTRARGAAGSPATASRRPARTAFTPASTTPGGRTASGRDRAEAHAVNDASVAGDSFTVVRTTAPAATSDHACRSSPDAVSITVTPERQVVPRASTACRTADAIQMLPPGPVSTSRPSAGRSSTSATAPSAAS